MKSVVVEHTINVSRQYLTVLMILGDFNVCSDFPYYLNSLFMQFYLFSVDIQSF